MGSSTITPNMAWEICAWVDQGASGSPPAPWTTVFVPIVANPDFAVVLQDSLNPQQYALVIQGTTNAWDALLDCKINAPVSFSPVAEAYIAQGANQGLNNVLSLTDNSWKHKFESLHQFLVSIDWNANYLFLAGHSLGGTVASLIAPWAAVNLFGQQQPLGSLPAAIQAITFAPYAGGNQQFADFLNSQSNYQANFNTNDAVPHVWAMAGQYSVPNMYLLFPSPGPSPMPSYLQKLVQDQFNGMCPPDFVYVQTNGTSFTFPSAQAPLNLSPDKQWEWGLSYQHNYAYCMQFGGSASSCQYLMPTDDSLSKEHGRIAERVP